MVHELVGSNVFCFNLQITFALFLSLSLSESPSFLSYIILTLFVYGGLEFLNFFFQMCVYIYISSEQV
jgi:hypothetical protein